MNDQSDQKKSGQGSGQSTVAALGSAASSVKERVSDATSDAKEQLAEVGRKYIEKFQDAADYLRNADFKAMVEDVHSIVKRYPGAALAGAAVVGFLFAHAVHRRD
jgi:ElaB/YqjD/DUF883 family membrane-anchored ribosome-binding protein